jgi:hypothetical protein
MESEHIFDIGYIQMHSEKGKEQNLSKAMDDRLLKVLLSQRGI